MSDKNIQRVALYSAIPAILIMALIFDFAVSSIQMRNVEGAGYEPILVVLYSLFELILVSGGMGLAWGLFKSDDPQHGPALALAIIGLLVVFASPLLFFLPVPEAVYALVEYVRPGTFLFQAGGLLAAAGLLRMIIKPGS